MAKKSTEIGFTDILNDILKKYIEKNDIKKYSITRKGLEIGIVSKEKIEEYEKKRIAIELMNSIKLKNKDSTSIVLIDYNTNVMINNLIKNGKESKENIIIQINNDFNILKIKLIYFLTIRAKNIDCVFKINLTEIESKNRFEFYIYRKDIDVMNKMNDSGLLLFLKGVLKSYNEEIDKREKTEIYKQIKQTYKQVKQIKHIKYLDILLNKKKKTNKEKKEIYDKINLDLVIEKDNIEKENIEKI